MRTASRALTASPHTIVSDQATALAISPAEADVHVWVANPDEVTDLAQLTRCKALLSVDELARYERFVFARDRHLFLVAHATLRRVLSRYAGVHPAAWAFEANEYGRPNIAAGICDLPLRFNLSHTYGLVACAVRIGLDVGVDVERLSREVSFMEVADQFFAPAEVEALRALPATERFHPFFEYWTLKEAYIKARGMGLAIPLRQFAFNLESPDRLEVKFDPTIHDEPTAWHFELIRPTLDHVLAVAARRGRSASLSVQLLTVAPP